MPRFFLAVSLPDEAKDRLLAVRPHSPTGLRLVERHELHLTLHFLGELTASKVETVKEALRKVKAAPFSITFKGVGKFPPAGQPQVFWCGVENNLTLLALHQSIAATLTAAIGFQPEERPYSPHVTLAHVNLIAPLGVVERFLEHSTTFEVPRVLLNRYSLYSSAFKDDAPRYQEEAVFFLSEALFPP